MSAVPRSFGVLLNTMVSRLTPESPEVIMSPRRTASPATTVLASFTARAMRHM